MDTHTASGTNSPDLRPATVDQDLVERLASGRQNVRQSVVFLERTLLTFVREFGGPTRSFAIAPEALENECVVAESKLAMFRHLLGVRLGSHLTETVDALSGQRTLSMAQAVRAVMETAGAAAYYESRFRGSADSASALHAEVHRALYGQRFEWGEWKQALGSREALDAFFRKRRQQADISPDRPPSVMTFIDHLAKRLKVLSERHDQPTPLPGHVRAVYEQLCDFVHPSIGTWMTYGHTEPQAFRTFVASSSRLESLQYLWFGIADSVAGMACVGLDALRDIERLRGSLPTARS